VLYVLVNIRFTSRDVFIWFVTLVDGPSPSLFSQTRLGVPTGTSDADNVLDQQHSRRCDAAHDGGFALQSTFFGALHRRAAPENPRLQPKARKNFDGPQSPVPQGECAVLHARMYVKHGYQASPLLGASVHGSEFSRRERAHRPF
jgi:hypothetical protein